MKTTLLILLSLFAIQTRTYAREGRIPAEEGIVLAVAEATLVAKFGSAEVDAARPLRMRVVLPGKWWRVEGTPPKTSIATGEVLVAVVRMDEGQFKATALKRPSAQKPNKAPEPTLGIARFPQGSEVSNAIAGVAHL